MRVLGLDVGSVTIGVAVCDPLGMFAHPVETIRRVGRRADAQQVARITRETAATCIVLGLPIRTDGKEGDAALESRRMGEAIAAAIPGVVIEYLDERFTTAQAERSLVDGGMHGRKKKKAVIDQVAAVLILQDFLDRARGSLS